MGNISPTEHLSSLLGVSIFFIRNEGGREKEKECVHAPEKIQIQFLLNS